jgi:hypothetical protein
MKTNTSLLIFLLFSISCFSQDGLVSHLKMSSTLTDTESLSVVENYGGTFVSDRFNSSNESTEYNGKNSFSRVVDPSYLSDGEGSIALWVYIDSLPSTTYVSAVGDTLSSSKNYISLPRIDGTDSVFGIYCNIDGQSDFVNGQTKLKTKTYYQVVITSSGSKWSIYVDGKVETLDVKYGNNSGDWFGDLSDPDAYYIGSAVNSSYFNGKIDEIKIFNRELTETEVFDLYNEDVSSITPIQQEKVIAIYPNPVTTNLMILNNKDFTRYQICSIDGIVRKSGNIESNLVEMENLSPGMYIIKLESDTKSLTQTFIKK